MFIIDTKELHRNNPEILAIEDYIQHTDLTELILAEYIYLEFNVIEFYEYHMNEKDDSVKEGWYRFYAKMRNADRFQALVKFYPNSYLSSNLIN